MRPDNTSTLTDRATPESSPHEAELAAARAELAAALVKIKNLEVALATRGTIGTAVGIIMATYKVAAEPAFDLLVMSSQSANQKLRDVAQHVIETGDLGHWTDRSRPRSQGGVPSNAR